MAYQLNLLIEFEHVHNVIHILQLRRRVPDPSHIIETEPIEAAQNLADEDCTIQILDLRVK